MNALILLQAQAGQQGGAGQYSFLIMMVLIFVIMWLFMIRPQQKKQKELNNFRNSLKKGDKVVTVGGIYGVVSEVKETTLIVEVSDNCKLKVDKSSVVKDISDVPATK